MTTFKINGYNPETILATYMFEGTLADAVKDAKDYADSALPSGKYYKTWAVMDQDGIPVKTGDIK